MANTKISALTSATTPLAGTEVLPIVQSSATVKVATNDLTVRNVRANATTGILQVTGPLAATTRVMTTPDANFTVARTDAAQSFTGDQTLSTGNIIQGTAAKGFNFTANTPAAGMTSQLLNWYEEGTWTPGIAGQASGSATLSTAFGVYTRIGRQVVVKGRINFSASTLSGGQIFVSGLPFRSNNTANNFSIGAILAENITYGGQIYGFVNPNELNIYFLTGATGAAAGTLAGAAFGATSSVTLNLTYFI